MGTGHRKVSFNRSKEIDVGILNSCSLLAGFTYCLPCFSWSPPWILSEGLQFHILLIDGCTTSTPSVLVPNRKGLRTHMDPLNINAPIPRYQ